MLKSLLLASATAALALGCAEQAMACGTEDDTLGSICIIPVQLGCPANTLPANGQLLPVQQYMALYGLLGNLYGGTPGQNFNLPDLRSRTVIGAGAGTNLSAVTQGAKVGSESYTLTPALLPPLSGTVVTSAATVNGSATAPGQGLVPGVLNTGGRNSTQGSAYVDKNATAAIPINAGVATISGASNAPIDNRAPQVALDYCIQTVGLWPMRD